MLPANIPVYPAPAKLNLDLRIIGRRSDGYHELESVFVLLDWCDRIGIAPRRDGKIVLHNPIAGVLPEQDLTVRAANALKPYAAADAGVDLYLDKHLPMGGGLGGGSSDAATVLWVLNRVWQCGLTQQQLMAIGVGLGADVPFFLFGESAFARGIGEQLQSINAPVQHYLVACPDAHVVTADVFRQPDLTRNSQAAQHTDWQALQPLRNDMQAVVLASYPPVRHAYETLSAHAETRMTGSGACLFAAFDSLPEAQAVAAKLPSDLRVHCASGLVEHPLRHLPII